MIKKGIFLILSSLIFLLVGCSTKEDLTKITKKVNPTMHELGNVKLKTIMHELNNLVFEQFYSELERDELRVQHTREIAKIAHSIEGDISKIGLIGNELKLNDVELKEFMRFTKELGDNASNLEYIAKNYQVNEIKRGINRLVETCHSCHQRFRKDFKRGVK